MPVRKSLVPWKIFAYSIMVLFTILAITPLFWLLTSSFKPHAEIVRNPLGLPRTWYMENFRRAWTQGSLGVYFMNSVFYSIIATSITTLFALGSGYTFAKFNYRISKFFFALYTLGLLITVHSVIVPLFVLETYIGIGNTRLGVIIPYIAFGLPFAVYLATGYLKGIPDSLEEAALIDGATYMQIFQYIIVPVATPIIATMFIYTFLSNWNEFVLVLTLTSKTAIRSLPVGINSFAGGMSRDYGLQFSALVIGTIPMILFYLIFHEYLERGFAAGISKE